MTDRPPTPAATLHRARRQGQAAGLKHVYTGNIRDIEGGIHPLVPGMRSLRHRSRRLSDHPVVPRHSRSVPRLPGIRSAGRFDEAPGTVGTPAPPDPHRRPPMTRPAGPRARPRPGRPRRSPVAGSRAQRRTAAESRSRAPGAFAEPRAGRRPPRPATAYRVNATVLMPLLVRVCAARRSRRRRPRQRGRDRRPADREAGWLRTYEFFAASRPGAGATDWTGSVSCGKRSQMGPSGDAVDGAVRRRLGDERGNT